MRIRDWDRNLKVRLFGEAAMNITFWMFFPFLIIYFAEAFGKEKAGFLLVLSQLFSVAANLMGGYCADRFGRKRMMVLSAFGQGAAFLIFSLAVSPWMELPALAFICFTIVGVFGAFYWPASQAMVADVVDEKNRSSVFAVFYTSINIAVVIGPILGALFYVNYRFQLLVAAGLVCILLSILLSRMTRETAPDSARQNIGTNGRWYGVIVKQVRDYGIIFKDRTFLLFIVAGILSAQTFMQLDMLIPVYTKDIVDNQTLFHMGSWHLSVSGEQAFGLLLAENGLLVALFTIAVTKWMGSFRESRVFILSSVFYAAAITLFGQVSFMWGLIFAMAVFTFAELMTAGIQQNFISKIAPEHMRGQYFAAASLRYTIGKTIAPIAIPFSVWFGYQWTFFILGLLALLSALLYFTMFSQYKKSETLPAEAS
ncbi:MFS transporter [Bacillus lacus]|uniref:MFS transporter n=1 Tax=Metabacillus lacus TaxID=1983721 RepID=A0A7X2M1G1_9BACI|nr:MFS transporter [Metabacillus lacus]MRX74299.1 MFS transporter [Metabacillus lacus]